MNISDLVLSNKEVVLFEKVHLSANNKKQLEQLLKEYKYAERLAQYGLEVNHKILLFGHSGCGKTMTAKAIANTLQKNITILNLSNVVCSRIGETAQNIKQVFDKATRERSVLFLDEFDQIGKERSGDDKDVGEMRRLVNTIIQLIDYLPVYVLLICATNHKELIDTALLRRFQLQLEYDLPNKKQLDAYYDVLLEKFQEYKPLISRRYDISFAQAKDDTYTQLKSVLISQWEHQDN